MKHVDRNIHWTLYLIQKTMILGIGIYTRSQELKVHAAWCRLYTTDGAHVKLHITTTTATQSLRQRCKCENEPDEALCIMLRSATWYLWYRLSCPNLDNIYRYSIRTCITSNTCTGTTLTRREGACDMVSTRKHCCPHFAVQQRLF